MKRWNAWCLVLLLLAVLTTGALAAGTQAPALTLSGAAVKRGEEFTVNVTLDSAGSVVNGGGFDLRYDNTVLTLIKATAGTANGNMITVNPKYAEDTVKVSFAGVEPLPQKTVLCTLTFRASPTAEVGPVAVGLENVQLYDGAIAPIETVSVAEEGISVLYVGLRVAEVQAVPGQAVPVELHLEGDALAAGGNFDLIYDPQVLTVSTAVISNLPSEYMFTASTKEEGKVHIVWAGEKKLEQTGVLCSVYFGVKDTMQRYDPLTLENVRIYDENGSAVTTKRTDGSVTVVTATETAPKLWVVGGCLDENGEATATVVLQGKNTINGGNFELTYDPARCTLLESRSLLGMGAVNADTAGKIKFSWAGANAFDGSVALLELRFRGPSGAPLTLGNATVYDDSVTALGDVQYRSGKLVSASTGFQPPTLDEISEDGKTAYVDIAEANGTEQYTAILARYDGAKMERLSIPVPAGAVDFDRNGVGQIRLPLDAMGADAKLVKLILLDSVGNIVPSSESLVLLGAS